MLSTTTVHKVKLGVLASGTGSNLEAIINASQHKAYPAYVGVVLSDKKDAPALKKAIDHNIPGVFINPKLFESKSDYDQMLLATLKQYQVHLVILAGFMRILSPVFVQAFPKKILNIHPALLPQFPGAHAVQEVLKAGLTETGCTVHYVDEGVDTGPIILSSRVPILKNDTESTLHKRIQEQEHLLYPKAIAQVIGSLK